MLWNIHKNFFETLSLALVMAEVHRHERKPAKRREERCYQSRLSQTLVTNSRPSVPFNRIKKSNATSFIIGKSTASFHQIHRKFPTRINAKNNIGPFSATLQDSCFDFRGNSVADPKFRVIAPTIGG